MKNISILLFFIKSFIVQASTGQTIPVFINTFELNHSPKFQISGKYIHQPLKLLGSKDKVLIYLDNSRLCEFSDMPDYFTTLASKLPIFPLFKTILYNKDVLKETKDSINCSDKLSGSLDRPFKYFLENEDKNKNYKIIVFTAGNISFDDSLAEEISRLNITIDLINYSPITLSEANLLRLKSSFGKKLKVYKHDRNKFPFNGVIHLSFQPTFFSHMDPGPFLMVYTSGKNEILRKKLDDNVAATQLSIFQKLVVYSILFFMILCFGYILVNSAHSFYIFYRKANCKNCEKPISRTTRICRFCSTSPCLVGKLDVSDPREHQILWLDKLKHEFGSHRKSEIFIAHPKSLKNKCYAIISKLQADNGLIMLKLMIPNQYSGIKVMVNKSQINKDRYLVKGDKIEIGSMFATVN